MGLPQSDPSAPLLAASVKKTKPKPKLKPQLKAKKPVETRRVPVLVSLAQPWCSETFETDKPVGQLGGFETCEPASRVAYIDAVAEYDLPVYINLNIDNRHVNRVLRALNGSHGFFPKTIDDKPPTSLIDPAYAIHSHVATTVRIAVDKKGHKYIRLPDADPRPCENDSSR